MSRPADKPAPDDAIRMLKAGNERFRTGAAIYPNLDEVRLDLAGTSDQGDHAYAAVLSCSDSRVPVELIFDAGIMDLFVIRVAGNVCNKDEIGSIEYGLVYVHTPLLVVLGHTQCGAVTTVARAASGPSIKLERNIKPLADSILPAVKRAVERHPHLRGDEIIQAAIEENVWLGIEEIFMRSPVVRGFVRSGKAKVVGAIYDVGTGEVRWLPAERVDAILRAAEDSSGKATEPFAD